MKALWFSGAFALAAASDSQTAPKGSLYLFFTPADEPDLPSAPRRFVPQLLLDRPFLSTQSFARTLRRIEAVQGKLEIPVFNIRGLALAREVGLAGTPAWVWISGGRAHIAQGSRVDLEELLQCRR